MNRAVESPSEFTPKQGQYLAFIDAYTLVNGRPPAQSGEQIIGILNEHEAGIPVADLCRKHEAARSLVPEYPYE